MTDNYRQFYEEHKNRLFSYLLYRCRDYETSLDIMQESFTRHFQHYRHRAASSPALLFTIARNALVDHQRCRNKETLMEDLQPGTTDNAEQTALHREEYQRVRESVDNLPEPDREILSLAVGGLAYKEIAHILGISETNVKVKIHRARMKLRQMLSNEEVS